MRCKKKVVFRLITTIVEGKDSQVVQLGATEQ